MASSEKMIPVQTETCRVHVKSSESLQRRGPAAAVKTALLRLVILSNWDSYCSTFRKALRQTYILLLKTTQIDLRQKAEAHKTLISQKLMHLLNQRGLVL